MDFLARAERHVPADAGVRDCWGFVIEGIGLGWLNPSKVRKLISQLKNHEDYGLDELLFELRGDRLRVSLLDDHAECAPAAMLEELESLVDLL